MSIPGKRVPIRNKVRGIVLLTSMILLLTITLIGAVSLTRIRSMSRSSLADQLQQNLYNTISDKATLSDAKFGRYTSYVQSFADSIQDLYEHPDSYARHEIAPPHADGVGKLEMQRYLRDGTVHLDDVYDEMTLLSNMETAWRSAMSHNADAVISIYLGTESGLMVSYDLIPELAWNPEGAEYHYNYTEKDWYTLAKSTGSCGFTNIYPDGFGRGLMVSCYAPFYDEAGEFRGAVALDILFSDIYDSIVSVNLGADGRVYLFDRACDTVNPDVPTETSSVEDIIESEYVVSAVRAGETGFWLERDDVYYAYAMVEDVGWELCIRVPFSYVLEPMKQMDQRVILFTVLFLAVFVLLVPVAGVISFRFSKTLTDPLVQLGKDAMIISGGNLDYRAVAQSNDEIGDLAETFNTMAADLKAYMEDLTRVTAEKERISVELHVATEIQANMLPQCFPPYPERTEFEIYASMTPAREVGGDFYDLFLVDNDHLALVMADVTGKGVPAALFMVIAKTMIKNRCLLGGSPAEILGSVNTQLCEGNEAELFVTVWLAIVELSTGRGVAANAGHEHPALRRAGGAFELVKYRHSPALATVEQMRFKEHSFQLNPGDSVFVYTDGVTEATNAREELFGEERLVEALNAGSRHSVRELLRDVRQRVSLFVGDAPQFDDMTMLGFTYFGPDVSSVP